VRRNAVGQVQEPPKPRLVGTSELRNVHPPVGAAERRRDGDHHHVEQLVSAPQRIARVFQDAEMTHQRGFGGFECKQRLGSNRYQNQTIVDQNLSSI
jgi:hypothetical protein